MEVYSKMFRLGLALITGMMSATAFAAQTCDDTVAQTTPTSAFTDNGDGTVTDNYTGLMWKKCAEGLSGNDCATGAAQTFTWQMALQQVTTINADTSQAYNDWRLPNIKELASIVELQCESPTANLTLFPAAPDDFDVNAAFVWSSTPSSIYQAAQSAGRTQAWGIRFIKGETAKADKSSAAFVRLVRN